MTRRLRHVPVEIGLAGLVLVVHLYALLAPANSLMLAWFHSDDAFYYFKTAQNFAEGYGFSFDRIARSSGFHPLWMLVCIPVFALARFDLVLPLRLVVAISAVLNAGTTTLVYRLARRGLAAPAALVTAVLWAFSPYVHGSIVKLGLESGLSAFFIALLLYRVAGAEEYAPGQNGIPARQVVLTGAVAALAVLARLDNVFLVCVAGAWLAIRPRRLRYLAVTDALLAGLGVIWSYFARVGFQPGFEVFSRSSYVMVALALTIRLPLYYLFGLYARPASGARGVAILLSKTALVSSLASALVGGLMLGLLRLGAFPGFPRLVLPYEAGFGLAAALVTRLAAALLDRVTATPDEPLRWGPTLIRAGLFFAPIGAVLMVYVGLNQWYFGTPSPVSGQIKRWWGTLPNPLYGQPPRTLAELLGLSGRNQPWGLAADLARWPEPLLAAARAALYGVPALALLLGMAKRSGLAIRRLALYPLWVAGMVQLLSYTGTGYIHTRPWYWAAQDLLVTLLLGVLLDHLLTALARRFPASSQPVLSRALRYGLPALLALGLLARFVVGEVKNMPLVVGAGTAGDYLGGVRALEARTEPGARIGSTGGGVIAYFLRDRTMINLDGLMNGVEYFHLLRQGRASQYLTRIGLDYVYTGEYGITSSDPYFQFKDHLRKIDDVAGSTLFDWVP
jgi:hypothetical protein